MNASRPVCLLLLFAISLVSACRTEPGRRVVVRVNGRAITTARLLRALPDIVSAERDMATQKRVYLDRLIDLELIAAEAERRGLDELIEYHYEISKKGYVIQELYRHVTAPARDVTQAALDSAYQALVPEYRLRLIEVDAESTARILERELREGVAFESLAVRWSVLGSASGGGDVGWTPSLWLEPEVKAVVERLEPGEATRAIPVRDRWQFAKVEDRREPDPPPPPLEQMSGALTVRLRQHRQQILGQEYQARLRRRLEYRPEGLAVVAKRTESITPAELELPVAIRDSIKYVKVGRVLHIIERFPPAYDSAMRRYAVQRAIEEDVMYDDALEIGLDRVPTVQDSVAEYRRHLLHQALYERVITDSVTVSETELRGWYEQNQEQFGGADFEAAATYIEDRLLREKRTEAYRALVERLRAQAKIRIYERSLGAIRQNPDGSWQ